MSVKEWEWRIPNPIGATLDRVAYDLYFKRGDEWVYLGSADRTKDAAVGSHEVVDVEVSHSTVSTVAMALQALRPAGTVDIRAHGSVSVKTRPLSLEVPLEHARTVALVVQHSSG